MVVVESGQVLLQLEGRVELFQRARMVRARARSGSGSGSHASPSPLHARAHARTHVDETGRGGGRRRGRGREQKDRDRDRDRDRTHTSFRGTSGGPAAMSSAFVPGCMRRRAFASLIVCSICCVWRLAVALGLGDSWISAGGGGLGNRGDPCVRDMARVRTGGGQLTSLCLGCAMSSLSLSLLFCLEELWSRSLYRYLRD